MIELDDDKARLDVARVHGWLASSYWSPGIERALVERAIAGSHCLGAYDQGEQVGYARMITDHATFAWLADVWVDERARGQGVARAMVKWFVDHPDFAGIRRMALVTADAEAGHVLIAILNCELGDFLGFLGAEVTHGVKDP